jgi:ankyrin repeat protein
MNGMIEAIKAGDADKVRALLSEDVTLANAKDADGTSAVLIATYWGKRDIKKILLAAKPELSVHEAAAVGDEARVMSWIKTQPELLEAYSQDGFTPLHLGAFFCHADVVKFLLARGANVNAISRNPMQLQALHSSAAASHIPITKLLLANGADVNAKQQGGFTPIHAAAQNGNAEMTKLLLEWGADPSAKTDEGKSARDFAAEGSHAEVTKLLEA